MREHRKHAEQTQKQQHRKILREKQQHVIMCPLIMQGAMVVYLMVFSHTTHSSVINTQQRQHTAASAPLRIDSQSWCTTPRDDVSTEE